MLKGVMIPASDQRSLEGLLHSKEDGELGVILLHPYGGLGGSMDDMIVQTLFRAVLQLPKVRHVIAYNQAGVGRSSGRRWGASNTDRSDLNAVVQHLQAMSGNLKLVLIGYSYGASVAASGLSGLPVAGFGMISPAIGLVANAVLQTRSMVRRAKDFSGPMLVALGTCDQFASVAQVESLLSEFTEQRRKYGQPPRLVPFEGCDHFFSGDQQDVAQLFCNWLCQTDFR